MRRIMVCAFLAAVLVSTSAIAEDWYCSVPDLQSPGGSTVKQYDVAGTKLEEIGSNEDDILIQQALGPKGEKPIAKRIFPIASFNILRDDASSLIAERHPDSKIPYIQDIIIDKVTNTIVTSSTSIVYSEDNGRPIYASCINRE